MRVWVPELTKVPTQRVGCVLVPMAPIKTDSEDSALSGQRKEAASGTAVRVVVMEPARCQSLSGCLGAPSGQTSPAESVVLSLSTEDKT